MSKTINLSIDDESLERFDKIVKNEFSDRSKLLRKWIMQNYKEEYDRNESERKR